MMATKKALYSSSTTTSREGEKIIVRRRKGTQDKITTTKKPSSYTKRLLPHTHNDKKAATHILSKHTVCACSDHWQKKVNQEV